AEDGIRGDLVTGVQTCALPIWLLGTGDSTCLVAGSARRVRIERRVFLNCDCRGRYRGSGGSAVPAGPLEAAEDLMGSVSSKRCRDRKSTRLNSSHQIISYAVFC